jgi:hypothetical protein
MALRARRRRRDHLNCIFQRYRARVPARGALGYHPARRMMRKEAGMHMTIFHAKAASIKMVLIAGAMVAGPSAASAQGTAEERSACIGDAFQFCMADIPNVSQIEACLIKNKDKLQPACRAEFEQPSGKTRLQARHLQR